MSVKVVEKNRLYQVADSAIQQAKELGLSGAVVKRLQRMAMRSAPLTHPDGNRRFDDFVLMVVNKQIVGINRL